MSELTRRALLRALSAGGVGLAAGCVVPSKPAPVITQPNAPLYALPRRPRGLWVGAASIDITPPDGARTFLAGYGFQRLRRTVRDPISARCLYVDDGVRRVALIVADIVGLLRPSVQRIRRLVGNGVDVAVVSTHNHQSPDTMGYWGRAILYAVPYESGLDPSYQRVFERRLAVCAAAAATRARPARLAYARGEIPEGVVRNLRNPGVYDRAIEVVEAVAEDDGASLAVFVNLGCHPETLGDRSFAMSADFPGRLRARIDEARSTTSVFANGILGGMITPEVEETLGERERSGVIDHLGDTFAAAALAALREARPIAVDRVSYRRRDVELSGDNALFEYVERVGLIEQRERGPNGGLITEVGRIDLGPASWGLLPGEPTPMVGGRVKAQLAAPHAAVIGLANDELGYILDPSQYDDPEFAYEVTVSVGREIAPRLEAALADL